MYFTENRYDRSIESMMKGMLAACSDFGTAVKAAEIGGGNDVNLDCYGEYISNDELGELISYGGYISKSEYARHINDDSVGASYTPSFEA